MSKKFGVLRFIGTVYKIIGVILAVIAVLAAVIVIIASIAGGTSLGSLSQQYGGQGDLGLLGGFSGAAAGIAAGIGILIGLGLAALTQYAIGEAIYLFLAIEENTRATAALIKRQQE